MESRVLNERISVGDTWNRERTSSELQQFVLSRLVELDSEQIDV